MATLTRPDGAVIHYQITGQGHPLLLLAPGGVSSQIEFWQRGAIDPVAAFSDRFMVIAMDQRFAGRSVAPFTPFSYELTLADQLAVLDALDLPRAHVMGGCIGCAHALKLLEQAPARVSAAVLQDPVGLDSTNSMDTFYDMFNDTIRVARADGLEAVIAAAMENPVFTLNHAGGPWAQRLHDDEAFRHAVLGVGRETYIAKVVEFRDGMWPWQQTFFSVNEVAVSRITQPLLVLPGGDAFHPTGVGELLCSLAANARCLSVDARSETNLAATTEQIAAFLLGSVPSPAA